MKFLFLFFILLNFTNFFLLFQSESFILFFSFFFIISFFYAFSSINLKSIHLDNLKWIETVRFYIILANWHKSYIRLNELKVANFYKLVRVLKKNLFIKLQKIENSLIVNHYNYLKRLQLLRLAHLETKLKMYKEIVRLNNKNLKYKLLAGNI